MRNIKTIVCSGLILGLCACMDNQSRPGMGNSMNVPPAYNNVNPGQNYNNNNTLNPAPTYSTNGAYDDNGAEPPPNAGNQNFGRRY